jgi:hypothetical protein
MPVRVDLALAAAALRTYEEAASTTRCRCGPAARRDRPEQVFSVLG